MVETVFEELTQKGKTNLLSVAQTLASLAFGRAKNETDQEWLLRRYRQMFDVVKDTPVYKEMTQDALKEGLEKGREEGREEGQKEALQQMLMDIIVARFPKLVRFARRQLSDVDDPALLRLLVLKVSTAQTAEEAREQLLTIVEEADEDQETEHI